MRSLIYNLLVQAKKLFILRDVHLTFHLGRDRDWDDPKFRDYTAFNIGEAAKVAHALSRNDNKRRIPQRFAAAHPEPIRMPYYDGDQSELLERLRRFIARIKNCLRIQFQS